MREKLKERTQREILARVSFFSEDWEMIWFANFILPLKTMITISQTKFLMQLLIWPWETCIDNSETGVSGWPRFQGWSRASIHFVYVTIRKTGLHVCSNFSWGSLSFIKCTNSKLSSDHMRSSSESLHMGTCFSLIPWTDNFLASLFILFYFLSILWEI